MKQFLLGLSVSFAFIAGCLTATIAQDSTALAAHAAPAGLPRWEYKCLNATTRGEAELNQLGAVGWELVNSDAACLKRPIM